MRGGTRTHRTRIPTGVIWGWSVRGGCVPPHPSAPLTPAEFDLSNSRSLATYHPKEKALGKIPDGTVRYGNVCANGIIFSGGASPSPTRVLGMLRRKSMQRPRGCTNTVGTGVLDCPFTAQPPHPPRCCDSQQKQHPSFVQAYKIKKTFKKSVTLFKKRRLYR